MVRIGGSLLAGLGMVAAAGAGGAQTDGSRTAGRAAGSGERGAAAAKPDRRPLPHANGREFRTLDAYLAHLRDYAGPTDRPWYREVESGLYRLERGNYRGDAPPQLFTRDDLERRFGFRRRPPVHDGFNARPPSARPDR